MLLPEIFCGGSIDTTAQTFALLLMCLTPEDVSKIRLGPLSSYTIASLRLFKESFGVEFKLKVDDEPFCCDNDSDDEDEEMARTGTGMKSSTALCSCLVTEIWLWPVHIDLFVITDMNPLWKYLFMSYSTTIKVAIQVNQIALYFW